MRPTEKETAPAAAPAPPTLEQLVAMTPEQLEGVDIALMNLRCAEGLPGSQALDIPAALTMIDRFAQRVETETIRNFHHYSDNPAEFENSEAYFRLLMMAVVMQEDFGLHYNPRLIVTPDAVDLNDGFSDDARNLFINGVTGPPMTGTCSSMPVLYVAVGRRLGFPLRLVPTKAHLFARWDDGRRRLNMEATARGFSARTDEEYLTFPLPVTKDEIAANRYLVSMGPREELASFLSARADCALTTGRYAHANWCIREAARLAPEVKRYRTGIQIVEQELADFRMRQMDQLLWAQDHPGEVIPAALRRQMRRRVMNP